MTTAARPLGQGLAGEPSGMKDAPRAADVEAAVADDAAGAPADPVVGRFHNRENPSPAEMAEMLREVQDSLSALDERLAGLEGAQDDSSLMTRRLASSVAEMGQTLARRVRSLEIGEAPRPIEPPAEGAPAPAPPPAPFAAAPMSRPAAARWPWTRRVNTLALILGLAALLGLIAIGLWVFGRQFATAGSSAKPPAPPATALAAPAAAPLSGTPTEASPSTAQKTASPPSTSAPRRHILHPVRHTPARLVPAAAPAAAVPATAVPAAPATTGFRSFGPAATNSVQKPSS